MSVFVCCKARIALPYPSPDTGFVRQKLLLRFVPFSRTTLWWRVKDGRFPAPIKISPGITAWHAEEVRSWSVQQGG